MTSNAEQDGRKHRPSRRESILSTASDLFWEQGYSATSMNQVAAALGIQKASLYHHVRAKETLLYELSVESLHRIIDAAMAVTEFAPLARLKALIAAHVVTALGDQSKHATMLTELRSLSPREREHVTELRDRYERIIEESIRSAQAAGAVRSDLEPKLLRLALLNMLNWSIFWYRPGGALTPEEIARAFTTVFLDGAAAAATVDGEAPAEALHG